jgi:hypothetical protein
MTKQPSYGLGLSLGETFFPELVQQHRVLGEGDRRGLNELHYARQYGLQAEDPLKHCPQLTFA